MNRPHPRDIVRHHLRFLVAAWTEDRRSDEELLRAFAEANDEDAFATLVGRHASLVWSICLRILRVPQDAEDAFQATFLRLARNACHITTKGSLTGWLHATARSRALDVRRSIERRRRLEERLRELAESRTERDPAPELSMLLEEELHQLPVKHLHAFVLCQLEGKTFTEAAFELGCSVAAVHRRVSRALELLRRRLTRRGVLEGVSTAAINPSPLPLSSNDEEERSLEPSS